MYNSPITMYEQIARDLCNEMDDALVREVRRVGFNIDKAELTRALAYDRNQYQKGLEDGMTMAKTWRPFPDFMPDPDERVLCCTETKKGTRNCVIGYHDGSRWCCGMNSNVIAWQPLPELPEV